MGLLFQHRLGASGLCRLCLAGQPKALRRTLRTPGPDGLWEGADAFLPLSAGRGHCLCVHAPMLECHQLGPRVLHCQVSASCCGPGARRLSENAGKRDPFPFLAPQGYSTPEGQQPLHPILLPFSELHTITRPLPPTHLPNAAPFCQANLSRVCPGHVWLLGTWAPPLPLTTGFCSPWAASALGSWAHPLRPPCILVHSKPKLFLGK